jgi:hypothetical protein
MIIILNLHKLNCRAGYATVDVALLMYLFVLFGARSLAGTNATVMRFKYVLF